MSSLQEIFEAAQALPAGERASLIHALWGTLDDKDWVPPSKEWILEAQHRSQQLDAAQMSVAPWAEVRLSARRQAGLDG
jgi:Putative addiction module component